MSGIIADEERTIPVLSDGVLCFCGSGPQPREVGPTFDRFQPRDSAISDKIPPPRSLSGFVSGIILEETIDASQTKQIVMNRHKRRTVCISEAQLGGSGVILPCRDRKIKIEYKIELMTDEQPANLLSFRTVIILHLVGIVVMILGSEASRSWTAALTEQDLGNVKQLLEDVSSSPWTILAVGIIPVVVRIAFSFYPQNLKQSDTTDLKKLS